VLSIEFSMRVVMVLLLLRWTSSLRLGHFPTATLRFRTTVAASTGGDTENSAASENRNFRDDFLGTRIFVQNLPAGCDWKQLKDHFKSAGSVVYASVSKDIVTNVCKGHGIVQYETTNEAKHALATMNNVMFQNSELRLRPDMQERRSPEKTVLKPSHWSTMPPKPKPTSTTKAARPGDKARVEVVKNREEKKSVVKNLEEKKSVVKDTKATTQPLSVFTKPSSIGPRSDEAKEAVTPIVSKLKTESVVTAPSKTDRRRNQILNLLDNEPEMEEEIEEEEVQEVKSVKSVPQVAAVEGSSESPGQHEFVRIKKNAALKAAKQASGLWTHDASSIPESVSADEVALIQSLVMERESYRASKQYERADDVRMALRRERRVQLNDSTMEWRVLAEKVIPV
jgi:RNA recognition motif-containing protein